MTGMPWFSSARERRLWVATAVVVAAIYATLPLAGTLAGELRRRSQVDDLAFFAFLAIAVAVVALGVVNRPGLAEVAVGLAVAGVYVLVVARAAIPVEERTHLVEYGVVAVLCHEALRERARHGAGVRRPAVVAILVGAALGVVDECIQAVLPNRVFDPVDIGFNVLAAVMAVAGSIALRRARRRRRRGSSPGEN